MKKLMIAAAIVCAAVASHAETYYWDVSSQRIYQCGSDYGDYVAEGTPAYLFMVTDDFNQQNVLNAVRGGKALADLSPAKTLSVTDEGNIGNVSFQTTVASEGDNSWFFLALQDGDNVYLSSKTGGVGASLAVEPMSATVSSEDETGDASAMFGGANWSAAEAAGNGGYFSIPEPIEVGKAKQYNTLAEAEAATNNFVAGVPAAVGAYVADTNAYQALFMPKITELTYPVLGTKYYVTATFKPETIAALEEEIHESRADIDLVAIAAAEGASDITIKNSTPGLYYQMNTKADIGAAGNFAVKAEAIGNGGAITFKNVAKPGTDKGFFKITVFAIKKLNPAPL